MPRLVRRAPFLQRLQAWLNPYDILLWLAEEFHDEALDEMLRDWTNPIAFALNVCTIIARANLGSSVSASADLFGDDNGHSRSRWLSRLASLFSYLLALVAIANAAYTFLRVRNYRLFEAPIQDMPSTPSARRVPVDSSPSVSSPIKYLSSLVLPVNPVGDQQKFVWEISQWDPKQFNLALFTLFSPGHVLIYWLYLPASAVDRRSSVTILISIFVSSLLSLQLSLLRVKFLQQSQDARLINKQVLNEYNTKFVHPSLNRPVRDVGVQTIETTARGETKTSLVDIYTPTTHVKRNFEINPNPAYVDQLDDASDCITSTPTRRLPRSLTTPALICTPLTNGAGPTPLVGPGPGPAPGYQSARRGDGGSLGVYSHAASPLKKAINPTHPRSASRESLLGGSSLRPGSPLKRMSLLDRGPNARLPSTFGDRGSAGLTQRFIRLGDRREAAD